MDDIKEKLNAHLAVVPEMMILFDRLGGIGSNPLVAMIANLSYSIGYSEGTKKALEAVQKVAYDAPKLDVVGYDVGTGKDKVRFSCYVVERTEWDEGLDTGDCQEYRNEPKVFRTKEEAAAFVEEDAPPLPFPMRWLKEERIFTGRSVIDGYNEVEVRYEIHEIPIE